MRERLTALGWSRIETVDEDLGRSAVGGVTRAGFDRMVAEERRRLRRILGEVCDACRNSWCGTAASMGR